MRRQVQSKDMKPLSGAGQGGISTSWRLKNHGSVRVDSDGGGYSRLPPESDSRGKDRIFRGYVPQVAGWLTMPRADQGHIRRIPVALHGEGR